MILCDPSRQTGDRPYVISYIEAVEGYWHGYMTKRDGVRWTRNANHPADPRCPECAS